MIMENIKVYGIDINKLDDDISPNSITDKEFIEIAENQGLIWSLKGFEKSFNDLEVNSDNIFIRFVKD
jgi:hypothetical protein